MKGLFRLLISFCLMFLSVVDYAQTFTLEEMQYIDSIYELTLSKTAHDTTKADAYVQLSENLYILDVDTIIPLCNAAISIAEPNLEMELDPKERRSLLKTLGTAYNNIGYVYDEKGDFDLALDFYQKSLSIEKQIGNPTGQATALNNLGFFYKYQGDIDKALEYYMKSLELRKQIGDKDHIANSLNNIAVIHNDRGNIPKALEFYHESLKLYELTGDKVGQALLLNNIGYINYKMDDKELAEEYYWKSLAIRKEINDQKGISNSYSNIGMIYRDRGDLDSALYYYQENIRIDNEIGYKQGEASSYVNLAGIYLAQGDTISAKLTMGKGLKLNQELSDVNGLAASYHVLGKIAFLEKDYGLAYEYGQQSLDYSSQLGFPKELRDAAVLMYRIHKQNSNYKSALEAHELYSKMKDSIWNENNQKDAAKNQFKYAYEKQSLADSIAQQKELKVKNAELAASKAREKAEQQQKIYLYIGLAIVALFGVFMYNRFRVTQRQKDIIDEQKQEAEKKKVLIEKQHHQLEETHQEISDSIKYAERLQQAILPDREQLKLNLGEGFVLFNPKDVVSGDFYWMQRVGNKVLFAAADCTGHGVPGAMVSVVCSNALNRCVKEFDLDRPDLILNKARELVIETFARSGKEVRDGMDISLCAFHLDVNNTVDISKPLEYAGANNPIWIARDPCQEFESFEYGRIQEGEIATMIEFKPNRMPVGSFGPEEPFGLQEIKIMKGDVLYLFTDGYADQFGGLKGKKLKYKTFKDILLRLYNTEMNAQKEILAKEYYNWKNDFEQIDDVCVIGVRI